MVLHYGSISKYKSHLFTVAERDKSKKSDRKWSKRSSLSQKEGALNVFITPTQASTTMARAGFLRTPLCL